MVATVNVPANCRVMPTCFMVLGSLARVQRQSLVTLVTNASQITALSYVDIRHVPLDEPGGKRNFDRLQRF
jgi:hypothetical protein